MKKKSVLILFITILALTTFGCFHDWAVAGPANPYPLETSQPDGEKFTSHLRGDEFQGWMETAEGYTVIRNRKTGFWEFANASPDGSLIPSGQAVRNKQKPPRHIPKGLAPPKNTDRFRQFQKSVLTRQHQERDGRFAASTDRMEEVSWAPGIAQERPASTPQSQEPEFTAATDDSSASDSYWYPFPVTGPHKLLILLVSFSDRELSVSPYGWNYVTFNTTAGVKSLANYFTDNSFNTLSLTPIPHSQAGSPLGILSLRLAKPHPDSGNSATYEEERDLLNSILTEAARYVPFDTLDSNGDGLFQNSELLVHVVLAGYETSNATSHPSVWAHSWGGDGVHAGDITLQSWSLSGELNYAGSQQPMGIIAHELGHLVCGLPDLYDIAGANKGLGFFSLMASGSWGMTATDPFPGTTPVALDAWSRQYLGWSQPRVPGTTTTYPFPPALSVPNAPVLLANHAVSTEQWFLAENRYDTGWDRGLEVQLGTDWQGGLLVEHIDIAMGHSPQDGSAGLNDINCSTCNPHQGIMVEEANVLCGSLAANTSYGDITHLFYNGNKTAFTSVSSPSTALYDGRATGLAITAISPRQSSMTATVTAATIIRDAISSTITTPDNGTAVKDAAVVITGKAKTPMGTTIKKVEVSTDNGQSWHEAESTAGNLYYSWQYQWTLPEADGSYTILSRATNDAPATEIPAGGVTVLVDRTPPTCTLTNPTANSRIAVPAITLQGSAQDNPGAGIAMTEISTDGGQTWHQTTGAATWTYDWLIPAAGHYGLLARATDKAGNVSVPSPATPIEVLWSPATVTSPTAETIIANSATFVLGGSVTDNSWTGLNRVEVSTDNGVTWRIAKGISPWSFTWSLAREEAWHTILARTVDNLGNTGPAGPPLTVFVDTLGPGEAGPNPYDVLADLPHSGAARFLLASGDTVHVVQIVNNTLSGAKELTFFQYDSSGKEQARFSQPMTFPLDHFCRDRFGNFFIAGASTLAVGGFTAKGGQDVYVGKFDRTGQKLWTRQIATAADDWPGGIATDAVGNLYLAGTTAGTLGPGQTNAGQSDLFITKLDTGGSVINTRQFGGTGIDSLTTMIFSGRGDLYLAGATASPEFNGKIGAGGQDMFLLKLDTGLNLIWTALTGSPWHDRATALAVAGDGSIYLGGVTEGSLTMTANPVEGTADTVIAKFAADGSRQWLQQQGTKADEEITDLAIDSTGAINAFGTYQNTTAVCQGLLLRYNANGSILTNQTLPEQCGENAKIKADSKGDLYLLTATRGLQKLTPKVVTINGGATATTRSATTLAFAVQDISGIESLRYSSDGVFDTETWQPYTVALPWTLNETTETQTVFAQFRDRLGNISLPFKDTITLTAPYLYAFPENIDTAGWRTYPTVVADGTALPSVMIRYYDNAGTLLWEGGKSQGIPYTFKGKSEKFSFEPLVTLGRDFRGSILIESTHPLAALNNVLYADDAAALYRAPDPDSTLFFPGINDGAAQGREQYLALVNTSGTAVDVTITITTMTGGAAGTDKAIIPAYGRYYKRPWDIVGSDISGAAVVTTDTSITGTLTTLQSTKAVAITEPAKAMKDLFFAAIDESTVMKNAVELFNPGLTPVTVTATLRTLADTVAGTTALTIAAQGRQTLSPRQLAGNKDIQGTLTVSAPSPVAGWLTQTTTGTDSALTAIAITQASASGSVLYFPKIYDGLGGYRNYPLLYNRGQQSIFVTAALNDNAGVPIGAVKMFSLAPGKRLSQEIEPMMAFNNGNPAKGSLVVTASAPDIVGLVSYKNATTNAFDIYHGIEMTPKRPPLATACLDADGDGYCATTDCDDGDPDIHLGAIEVCDGRDNDCDGLVDEALGADSDGDGFSACGQDCNDNDASVHPGAPEAFDGKDNNCNGLIDEGLDADGDGFTNTGGDCDDSDSSVHPRAIELCNDGRDNDCNGLADWTDPFCLTQPCTSVGDCPASFFCEKPAGACSSTGLCRPQPTACSPTDSPVCGCDRITYKNSCEANRSGMAIASTGSCPTPLAYQYYFPAIKDDDSSGWENYLTVQAQNPVPMDARIRVYTINGELAGEYLYSDLEPNAQSHTLAANARVAQRPSWIAGSAQTPIAVEGSVIIETSVPAIASANVIAFSYKGSSIYKSAEPRSIHYFPKAFDGPDNFQVYMLVQNTDSDAKTVTVTLFSKIQAAPGNGTSQTFSIPPFGTLKIRPSEIAGGINFDGHVMISSDLTAGDGLGKPLPAVCRYELGTEAVAIYESTVPQAPLAFPILKDGKFGTTMDFQNFLSLVNPNTTDTTVAILLYDRNGNLKGTTGTIVLIAGAKKTWRPGWIAGTEATPLDFEGSAVVTASAPIIGQTNAIYPGSNRYGADAFDLFEAAFSSTSLFFPKSFDNLTGSGAGSTHLFSNTVSVQNPETIERKIKIELFNNDGKTNGVQLKTIAPYGTSIFRPKDLAADGSGTFRGSIRITETGGLKITGAIKLEQHADFTETSAIDALTIYRSMGK